jgi:hypothetical protein
VNFVRGQQESREAACNEGSIQAEFMGSSRGCKRANTLVTVVYYRGAIVMTIVPLTCNLFSPIVKERLRAYGRGGCRLP